MAVMALRSRLARARQWLEQAPTWATFLVVFLPLSGLYLASAEYEYQNIDSIAVTLPAWQLAHEGNLTLDEFADFSWIEEAGGRYVSNRPPGLIGHAVPFYLFSEPQLDGPVPSQVPNAIAAALIAACAVAVLHVAFRQLGNAPTAIAGALLFGVATSTWSYSADQLWPHGPAQLWLAASIVAAAFARYLPAGLALGVGVLTRPVLAVVAATFGMTLGALRRDLRPILLIGAGSLAGLLLLVIYNNHVFGVLSAFTPNYGRTFVDQAAARTVVGYFRNLAGFFFSQNSFVFWSPVVILPLYFTKAAWRAAPDWVRSGFVAGVIYLLAHAALNRYSGGTPHNYRYPLEMLTLMAPMMFVAYREKISPIAQRVRIFTALAFGSFVLQFFESWKTYVYESFYDLVG